MDTVAIVMTPLFKIAKYVSDPRASERERLSIHGGQWYLSKKYGLSTIDIWPR
jgi:hypothetical protein